MESNQIRMKKTLKQFFSLEKWLEHCWGGERLVEIKPNARFYFFTLPNVVGYKHVLIAVDPDCMWVDKSADILHTPRYFAVNRLEFGPVIEGLL
jgi:hypothetical protein